MANESQSLAVRQIKVADWQMIQAISPTVYLSRLFRVASAEQAAVIALTGHELGLGLAASFSFIQIVLGKPTLSPRGALALVLNSGQLAELKIESTDVACKVWMKRKDNGFEHTEQFSVADAARAGLDKPDSNWQKYPKNMCKWRAIGFTLDTLFPDIAGGMKRADEFGATVDDAGDVVIEGDWTAVPSTPVATTETTQAPDSSVTAANLEDLIAKYGAEAIMVACEGGIPGTDEEVAAVAAKLAADNA